MRGVPFLICVVVSIALVAAECVDGRRAIRDRVRLERAALDAQRALVEGRQYAADASRALARAREEVQLLSAVADQSMATSRAANDGLADAIVKAVEWKNLYLGCVAGGGAQLTVDGHVIIAPREARGR